MTTVDVTAIIVNYNSGSYTKNLVENLQHEPISTRDGRPGRLQIVVVENESPHDQSQWLDPLEDLDDVQVYRTGENLGYGGGCNYGARRADGRNLLFMNPDVFVVPGGVDALNRFLDRHPDVGQVGPRGWFDAHRFLHLPRIELPTLSLHLAEAGRMRSRARAEAFALRRTKHALRIWSAPAPQEEPVLAGYAFMMPADLALKLGPFDETFPLYFEDADLTRTIRGAGYRCMLVPESEMVHLYNKSAGQCEEEALRKMATSQEIYWHKHYGAAGAWLGARLSSWLRNRARGREAHQFSNPLDLGEVFEPPELEVGHEGPYVLELTLDPLYTLAVGHLDERPVLPIPVGVWEHLDPTRFFLRTLSLPELRPLAAWTFHKSAPAQPIHTYQEFLQRLDSAERPRELCS